MGQNHKDIHPGSQASGKSGLAPPILAGQAPAALRFDQVSFAYRGVPVLHQASFHIHSGSFAALVGPNGAGKSTVLKLLVGLLQPQAGRILVDGRLGSPNDPALGYVPQHASFDPAFPILVRQVVESGLIHGLRRLKPDPEACTLAMEQADILDLASRPYGALSGGQRRRVLLARALVSAPQILLLDEPTANLDSSSEERLFGILAGLKGHKTILLVSHDSAFVSSLTDAAFCMGASDSPGQIVHHQTAALAAVNPPLAVAAEATMLGRRGLTVLHDTRIGDGDCCGGGQ